MRFAAVIVAAGSGERYGGPKHDLSLSGVPVWRHSVSLFNGAGADQVIVVGDVEGGVPGGRRRRDSVAAGLAEVSDSIEWVLVHDAARPLVTDTLVRRVLDAAVESEVDGVIPALAVTDTLKEVSGTTVSGTVDRSALVSVQTPQAFRRKALIDAHQLAPGADVTDDAGLIELAGGTVITVPGETTNMKITFGGDLEMAEFLLARLRNG